MRMIIGMKYGIASIISSERVRRGWDQAELASRFQVGQQTVSRWELGTSRPQRPMIAAIAELFELDPIDLLRAAGYQSELSNTPAGMDQPVRPLSGALPLDQLGPDQFEAFCRDFIALLRPGAEVSRFGSQGYKQDGIDLIARYGGKIESFQCKRHKTFGPEKVKKAIEAVEIETSHYYLILSRASASPNARKEIIRHVDWTLWDAEDVSRAIRFDLPQDHAMRLVDTYFPGWREPFLGIDEPGPWLEPAEFFQRHLRKEQLYSHAWDLVGRTAELIEIVDFATSTDGPGIALLTGRGGIGKSRLLRAIASKVEGSGHMRVRFVEPRATNSANQVGQLPSGQLVVIVDDAHDEPELTSLLNGILRQRPAARILLSTRPFARSSINSTLRSLGVHAQELPQWELPDLELEDAEQLAQVVLGEHFPPAVAQRLAQLTIDCPLITVVGAGLIRRGEIESSKLESNDSIRREVLLAFRDALVADPVDNHELSSGVINAAAIFQPLRLNDEAFRHAIECLVDAPFDRIARELKRLEDSGVVLRRGESLRIVPDLLGDAILTEACLTADSTIPTGYVERAMHAARGTAAQHLLINISRLDWQVRQGAPSAPHLIDLAWSKLEEAFQSSGVRARVELLKLVRRMAYYQPGRALALTKLAIDHPSDYLEEPDHPLFRLYPPSPEDVIRELPGILHDVAYDLDYLPEALDLLWQLAGPDPRPTNQYPEHPLRVLQDLVRYEPGKPYFYNQAALGVAERWIDSLDGTELHSPFDVLEAFLAADGHEHGSRGFMITWSRFSVNPVVTADLRRRVINLALREAASPNLKHAVRAVRAIGEGIRYPYSELPKQERDRWTNLFIETIEQLRPIVQGIGLDPAVSITIRDVLRWHVAYSTTATKSAAESVIASIAPSIGYDLALVLHDGWDWLLETHDGDYQQTEQELRMWREAVAARLLGSLKPDELVERIEERLGIQLEVFDTRAHPGPFVWTLVSEQPGIGELICRRVAVVPNTPLRTILPVALAQLVISYPTEALRYAYDLTAADCGLVREVAQAFSWNRGLRSDLVEGELKLLYRFAVHDDPWVRISAANAARGVADIDKASAISLALSIPFADDANVAREALRLFGSHGIVDWHELKDSDVDRLMSAIEDLDDIDEYSVQGALISLSSIRPRAVLRLLMNRIERMEAGGLGGPHGALPFRWYKPLDFRLQEDFPSILRDTRGWISENLDSWPRRRIGADLFRMIASEEFDEQVLEVLDEALADGSTEQVRTVGAILSEAPRSLILSNVEFVTRVLWAAERHGDECVREVGGSLHSRVTTGTRQGTPGEPFPEDVEQRDLAALAATRLPRGSIEQRFYRSLEQAADESIRWQAKHDADLLERRSW